MPPHQGSRSLHFFDAPSRTSFRVEPEVWQPGVDIYETNCEVVVLIDLAGIDSESVDITVKGRHLRISGRRLPRFRTGYRQFHRLEIPRGNFERVIDLPVQVDQDRGEASYINGLLEVALPFETSARPRIVTHVDRESRSGT